MTDTLVERLRAKSAMIHMGERIAFGSDTALMDEAAAEIERLRAASALGASALSTPPAPVVPDPATVETQADMSLAVALDFADHPRTHHTLQAPADTKAELYEALKVITSAYRAALSQGEQGK